MLTASLASPCNTLRDKIKPALAEQLKSVPTNFYEMWSCVRLGDGKSLPNCLQCTTGTQNCHCLGEKPSKIPKDV